ncbi:MAG: carbohydrate-binding protein [Clostridia bacterium]|nr:carbohydrate-binding protein [Clostridia bacterium]
MKRRILCLMLATALLIPALSSVNAGAVKGNVYFVGPREYTLTEKYLDDVKNAKMSGEKIELEAGGSVTFGFYLPFNAESLTLEFSGTPAPVSVSTGTEKYVIDPGESKEYTYLLDTYERIGEKIYTVSSNLPVKLSRLTFDVAAERSTYASAEKAPAISDEEFMLQNSFIIKTDCPMIIVNGGRRYINLDDYSELPIYVNGSVYIPIHTLARALGIYYEDLPDKKYVLLRNDTDELVFTEKFSYSNNNLKQKTPINNVVHYRNGRTYLPVRYVSEFYGRKVGYKDGMIAIDDNKYYVADILNSSTSVHKHVESLFAELMPDAESGKTYYVAKTANASDANSGTYDAPFKTITKAGQVAKAGDTVIVREGVYRETVTVKNNGTPTSPITFKAAEGEKVVISATEEIKDFMPYGENMAVAAIPYDMGFGKNQIFFGEKTIPEARYPNGPGIDMGKKNEPLSSNWPVTAPLITDKQKNLTVYNEELLNQPEGTWDGARYITVRGLAYATSYAIVEHSKPGELTLTEPSVYWWDTGTSNDGIQWGYLCGSRAALDEPGEWVIENKTLFIMPPEGTAIDELVVEAKARQLVVDIPDNKCVRFEGFTTIGGSMRLNNSELCVIKDCTIKYNNHYTYSKDQHSGFIDDANVMDSNGAPARGEVGLYVGGKDNIFVGNTFDEAAAAAIYGVGLYIYIENNLIKNCGYAGSYVAGLNFNGEAWKGSDSPRGGMVIVGNTAYNAGRSPLQTTRPAAKGEWAIIPYEVAFNDFHNGMLTSLDTGVVYTYFSDHGNNRKKTQMHHNFVYYDLDEGNPFSFGIYHDGGTLNIDTYNNLVFCTERGVRFTHEPYVFNYPGADKTNANNVWNNSAIKRAVTGGRDGLVPSDYPDGMMFDAGCVMGREPYTKNYEMIINNDPKLNVVDGYISAENAEPGAGAEYIGNDVRLEKAGEWVKFPAVDFGEGKNSITLYYKGDRYLETPALEIVIDDIDGGTPQKSGDVYFWGATVDDVCTLNTKLPLYSGKHDVYVRVSKEAGAIDISGIKTDSVTANDDATLGSNILYGGDFVDCSVSVKGGNAPEIKFGAMEDFSNPYAVAILPGSNLVYEQVLVEKSSDVAIIKYRNDSGDGGQKIQIRLNSLESEPLAEFETEAVQSGVWTEERVALSSELEPGTYSFYVTFKENTNTTPISTSLYAVKFGREAEERIKENTLYGGDFDSFIAAPDGELAPMRKFAGAGETLPYVNNTWPGTVLVYKDVELKHDSAKIIVNQSTDGDYSGQHVQVRIGSATAKPIAEFMSDGDGWTNRKDIEVPIKDGLAAGKYDIYLTFEEPGGIYVNKTCNLYTFIFTE